MGNIVKPAVTLFIICTIVSLLLAFTNAITRDTIQMRQEKDAEDARKEVCIQAESFKEIKDLKDILNGVEGAGKIQDAYAGLKGDTVVGYVFTAAGKGYGGSIKITVGVGTDSKITGVKIGENKETPGLGSKAKEKPFLSQLTGITPKEPLKVVKKAKTKPEEIEAISGATITSKAVTGAVQASVDAAAELVKREGNQN